VEKIIYANGTAEVLVPAGQKIAIATYGNEYATLSFKRGNNLEFIQRLDNAQVTLGPWTDVRTVNIEAAQDPVSYDVGTAPNIDSNVRMSSNPITGEIAILGPRGALGIEPKLYPANGQIKWGSYGDSIANVSGYANFDLRQINAAAPGFGVERMGSWVGPLSNGLFRLAANCGISGDNTTQMLARESAGASATRKAIIDAAATGVQFLVNSLGINDIQTLGGGASQATVDGVVNTAVANIVTLLKKQRANGIWPVTTSLMGYNLSTATAGEIAVRQSASRQFNAALGPIIVAANGELGSWVDVYSLVTDANGAWKAGLDQGDGLHPGANGCKVIYTPVVAEMLRVAGVMNPAKFAYGPQVNLFANPDFSASAAGTATGLNIYTAVGTCTLARSIVDWRGQNWQECLVTPTALDGNGNAGVSLDITIPATTIALGDVLGGELSVYIDDGAGGAPNVFQFMTRLRANTTYADTPLFNPTVSPKVNLAEAFDARIALLPIVSPAATPATCMISVIALGRALTPFRVRVALPRAFKLPSTY
jgi:hypothetical protein